MSAENEKSSLDEIKEYFEGQDRIIDQHGHACAYYDSAQDDSLGFQIVYTVGLSDVDWPELVCAAPLSPDRKASTNLTISILNAFVRALRSTETKPTAGIMLRSEEHTSELQSLMRISYAVFCLKKKTKHNRPTTNPHYNTTHNHTTPSPH